MDPNTGQLYTYKELAELDQEELRRLVRMEGKREDILRISEAVKAQSMTEQPDYDHNPEPDTIEEPGPDGDGIEEEA